ncbi:hypothetical protein T08_888 [Trichinella sp. T8]|nr:hypothetical protein T08_888 [Trichinella sp. T8]
MTVKQWNYAICSNAKRQQIILALDVLYYKVASCLNVSTNFLPCLLKTAFPSENYLIAVKKKIRWQQFCYYNALHWFTAFILHVWHCP